jgi:excinuclease UvrABC nuclease subunit
MASKTADYSNNGLSDLPNDKPVVYRILTSGGKVNYIGSAMRGRVPDRIGEHLDVIPGAKVQVRQFGSIQEARAAEARAIARSEPKYNKAGK